MNWIIYSMEQYINVKCADSSYIPYRAVQCAGINV